MGGIFKTEYKLLKRLIKYPGSNMLKLFSLIIIALYTFSALAASVQSNRVYNVNSYGANGNDKESDRSAIQNAINTASRAGGGVVYFPPGTYYVDVINASGGGITSLVLLNGVSLEGASRESVAIKLASNSYGEGAYYRLISSPVQGVSNVSIRNITIDGNRKNQVPGIQASNIIIEAPRSENITIENVRSLESNGQGIQVRGTPSDYGKSIKISGNISENHSGICIQVGQFDGLLIKDNIVSNCGNNGIDIYGENGTLVTHSRNYVISGNIVTNALVGIFNETVSDGVVANNQITKTVFGITVNRINGEPKNININGNNIVKTSDSGIRITGDTGGVFITNNTISEFAKSSVELQWTSVVTVSNNFIKVSNSKIPLFVLSGHHVNFSKIVNNNSTTYPVSVSAKDAIRIVTNIAVANTIVLP